MRTKALPLRGLLRPESGADTVGQDGSERGTQRKWTPRVSWSTFRGKARSLGGQHSRSRRGQRLRDFGSVCFFPNRAVGALPGARGSLLKRR